MPPSPFKKSLTRTSGYQYGWVRVVVSTYHIVLIKDFSLGMPLVDVLQYSNSNHLNIYPNPTNEQFIIETNTTDKLNADLFDINGRLVFRKIVSDKANIDVSTLNEGIYTLTIKTNDAVVNKKLVILR